MSGIDLGLGVRRWLAPLLAGILGCGTVPAGQQPPPPSGLRIVILDGEGAINNIKQRTAREPIVQIQDENDRPVAGAVVVFTLPDRGASGTFANGQTSVTVTTDAQGRAAGTGLKPNSVDGDLQIHIAASFQGRTATATISQTNSSVEAGGRGMGKTVTILLVVAAAAGGGAFIASRSGNGANGSPPPSSQATTFTPGTPSISPPR